MNFLHEIPWGALVGHAVPILFLIGLATVILLADLWWREHNRAPLAVVVTCGLIFTAWLSWIRWNAATAPRGAAMLYFDRITWMGGIILVLAAALTAMTAIGYLRERRLPIGEFVALLLFGVVGLWLMIATTQLLMLFLGLETLSLAAYVLAGFHRNDRRSIEAGLKYFLLGAVASAFLLFGMALLYGGTGTLELQAVAQMSGAEFTGIDRLYTMIGIGFVLIGLGFKIAAVPFQFWTPDVYEGAPLPVTAFFATGVKAGAFIALLRVAQYVAPLAGVAWADAVWWLAVATMTIGNLAALVQDDVKRMLAYSSIAHAGYGLIAIGIVGADSLLFYLIAYSVMTIGAFACLMAVSGETVERTALSGFAGLGHSRPGLAAATTIFLLSLSGIPPTVGFFAKYYLFQAAVGTGEIALVIIAVLNSVASVAYYVRPIIVMYFRRPLPGADGPVEAPALGCRLVILITLLGVLGLGLFPSPLLEVLIQTVPAQ